MDGENPLDASAVHPESYAIVDAMAKDLGTSVPDMMKKADLRTSDRSVPLCNKDGGYSHIE